jgi:hypothetical protein
LKEKLATEEGAPEEVPYAQIEKYLVDKLHPNQ